jgi:hypothetical protein
LFCFLHRCESIEQGKRLVERGNQRGLQPQPVPQRTEQPSGNLHVCLAAQQQGCISKALAAAPPGLVVRVPGAQAGCISAKRRCLSRTPSRSPVLSHGPMIALSSSSISLHYLRHERLPAEARPPAAPPGVANLAQLAAAQQLVRGPVRPLTGPPAVFCAVTPAAPRAPPGCATVGTGGVVHGGCGCWQRCCVCGCWLRLLAILRSTRRAVLFLELAVPCYFWTAYSTIFGPHIVLFSELAGQCYFWNTCITNSVG